jgi:hypothetical protein
MRSISAINGQLASPTFETALPFLQNGRVSMSNKSWKQYCKFVMTDQYSFNTVHILLQRYVNYLVIASFKMQIGEMNIW